MKIYIFGNPLVAEDSLPIHILPDLQKQFPDIHFIVVDPNENFPPEGERDLIILDTVKGISEVTLLDYSDLALIEKSPISPHDYDLLLHLLLLKKMGRIDKVKIIGFPSPSLPFHLQKV
ncbi:hypothetical protein HZC27_05245 [Candidatus Roizmanbacteria bacterium]|nr:hypothetical protein [Candidatus Roizmanbacteria bacterium]